MEKLTQVSRQLLVTDDWPILSYAYMQYACTYICTYAYMYICLLINLERLFFI